MEANESRAKHAATLAEEAKKTSELRQKSKYLTKRDKEFESRFAAAAQRADTLHTAALKQVEQGCSSLVGSGP